jgi:hypothetical protein
MKIQHNVSQGISIPWGGAVNETPTILSASSVTLQEKSAWTLKMFETLNRNFVMLPPIVKTQKP